MYYLTNELWFPEPIKASNEGLLGIGGDLSAERLLLAYRSGIFPWFEEGQPILWWSPDPRMVLFPQKFKVSKSLQKTLRSQKFTVTYNTCFSRVITACASIDRPGQAGTWITYAMQKAYVDLFSQGLATSVEVWQGQELVGGLYGVDLAAQKIFCGESMFSRVNDASKVGFYHLAQRLFQQNYQLIDCQIYNPHLESLGAEEIERAEFLKYLSKIA